MSQPTTPSIISNVSQTEESPSPVGFAANSGWRTALTDKTITFYTRPLFRKWRKIFSKPSVLVLSSIEERQSFWQPLFQASRVDCRSLQTPSVEAPFDAAQALIILDADASPERTEPLLQAVIPGGAVFIFTRNQINNWSQWEAILTQADFTDVFATGLHPQGAIAWWPYDQPFLAFIGQILEGLCAFFPGRYTMGLRYGRYWLIRAFKRDEQTVLT